MEWIDNVLRDVAELPDRNSPEDWPEAMLVTGDELRQIIVTHAPAEPVNARLLECISEAVSAYERYGGICTFEGEPMIYASTLIEIAEIAAEAQQAELVDERVIDRTWARFCGAFGDGPDAPYPGMIASFEIHYGQSFRDKEWRTEAACWAAAWSKATARAEAALAEPQPDADGWIPWEGGECPVLNMSRVDVVHRNGDIFLDRFAGYAQAKTWTHDDHPRDIIAYRVVEAQP